MGKCSVTNLKTQRYSCYQNNSGMFCSVYKTLSSELGGIGGPNGFIEYQHNKNCVKTVLSHKQHMLDTADEGTWIHDVKQ